MGQRGEGCRGTCYWSPESPVKWRGWGWSTVETLVQEGGRGAGCAGGRLGLEGTSACEWLIC